MVLEDLYGIDTGIELGLITDVVAEVNERTGVPVPLTKPVIGSMAFMIDGADWAAEAHLPADERMHSRLPFSPSHVGARSMMVWSDRTAGEEAVAIKLGVMGLPASPEATRTALALLSDAVHDRKAYPAWLTDDEFEALLRGL